MSDTLISESNTHPDLERRHIAMTLLGALGGAALLQASNTSEVAALPAAGQPTMGIDWVETIGDSPVAGKQPNLRGLVGSDSDVLVIALGYRSPGDGGGGVFVWISTSAIDNGGTIIVPNQSVGSATPGPHWQRIYSGPVDVKWFGAYGNGSTPDDIYLIRARDAVAASGGTVSFGPGTYRLSRNVTLGETVGLQFTAGAILAPDAGTTLTILGPLSVANAGQIFNAGKGAGKVSFGAPLMQPGDIPWARGGNQFIEHVNVKWWGAKSYAYDNDPSREDSRPAFQAALDTYRSVFVPDGVYYIDPHLGKYRGIEYQGIILPALEQVLFGTGIATSMLRFRSSTGAAITLGEENQVIRHIYVQNANSDPNRKTIGIEARKKPFLNLDYVLIGQFWIGISGGVFAADHLSVELCIYAAILLGGEGPVPAQECEISHFVYTGGEGSSQYGIVVSGENSGQHRIADGRISAVDINGIVLLDKTSHNTIENVVIKNCGRSGILLDSGAYNNTIQNCTIWANGKKASGLESGVLVADASLTKVVNCSIFDNLPDPNRATQAYGVHMMPASRGTIVANCVLHPNRVGAFVDNGTLNRIYGNSENNRTNPNSTIEPVDDVTRVKGTFVFMFGSNGPTISQGVGAPPPSPPPANGSLYLRTDGTGPHLYVGENGVWVPK
jgi:hypothetical protein